MMYKNKISTTAIGAFFIVLLSMPLGHAAMILMEHLFHDSMLNLAAFMLGLMGVVMTIVGSRCERDAVATLLGFIGGLLVWTGWIEFTYIYFAQKLAVAPLIENGEVVTKPEYLILMSSVGFWAIIILFYIFRLKSGCVMFSWIQRKARIPSDGLEKTTSRNKAFTVFMETNMLLWSCYLLLMFAYDKDILGDRHPVTIAIAFACLAWSLWLFKNLIKIQELGAAVRYALPTVMIFWTFVEVMGRIGIMTEIWVEPLEYMFEIAIMALLMVAILFALMRRRKG